MPAFRDAYRSDSLCREQPLIRAIAHSGCKGALITTNGVTAIADKGDVRLLELRENSG